MDTKIKNIQVTDDVEMHSIYSVNTCQQVEHLYHTRYEEVACFDNYQLVHTFNRKPPNSCSISKVLEARQEKSSRWTLPSVAVKYFNAALFMHMNSVLMGNTQHETIKSVSENNIYIFKIHTFMCSSYSLLDQITAAFSVKKNRPVLRNI